jgi:hypothetical protein
VSIPGGPRLVATVVSVFAGTAAAIIQSKLTDGWTWPLASALAVALVALALTQFWLTHAGNDAGTKVEAGGAGAVAAGGSVGAEIDSEVHGTNSPASPGGPRADVAATGPGSVAAGKDVTGRIKTRIWHK